MADGVADHDLPVHAHLPILVELGVNSVGVGLVGDRGRSVFIHGHDVFAVTTIKFAA